MPNDRTARIWPAALWAFAAAPAAWVASLPVERYLGQVMTLDAAAYPVIARNIVAGLGPTYDGETATNGVQPLWLLLTMPLMWGADHPMQRMRAVALLGVVCTWVALWRWSVALAALGAEPAAARLGAAILGGSAFAVFVLAGGMEAPLALALLAEVVRSAAPLLTRDVAEIPLGAAARLGLWAGAAVLA